MSTVFANSLTRKPVVGVDGVEFGMVHNITHRPSSGELVDIVVEPARGLRSRSVEFEYDENDRLRIPVDCVNVTKDTVVVHY